VVESRTHPVNYEPMKKLGAKFVDGTECRRTKFNCQLEIVCPNDSIEVQNSLPGK
jgi:hypothetical protein